MGGIIIDNIVTIIGSILTTVLTTITIFYIKNKKTRNLEFLEYSNHPIRMFNSFIMIVNMSNILGIWLSIRLYLLGVVEFNSYLLAFLLNQVSISLMIIILIKFHERYLDYGLRAVRKKLLFSVVMVVFWVLLIRCQYLIVTFIPRTAVGKLFETIEFIVWFYIVLFITRNYLKSYITKNFKEIIVTTKDFNVYHALEIKYYDDYIALHETSGHTRIILFRDNIESIIYEFQDKNIKEST